MVSKGRVRCAANHLQPDRVPTDFGAVSEVWPKLQQALGCSSRDEVLDSLDIHIRFVDPVSKGPPLRTYTHGGDRVEENWFGFSSRWHWNGFQADSVICDGALEDASTIEEVLEHAWPDPDWFDYESVRAQCERYGSILAIEGLSRKPRYSFAAWNHFGLSRAIPSSLVRRRCCGP